jgi:hypothetical protein
MANDTMPASATAGLPMPGIATPAGGMLRLTELRMTVASTPVTRFRFRVMRAVVPLTLLLRGAVTPDAQELAVQVDAS